MLIVEYTASGTPSPASPPTLSAPVLEAGNLRFSFNAESNRTYTVQFRDSLTAGNRATLTNLPRNLPMPTSTSPMPSLTPDDSSEFKRLSRNLGRKEADATPRRMNVAAMPSPP